MFNLGPFELVAIFVVALLVFGPDKLPEMGRQIGKAVREFRKFQESMNTQVRDVLDPIAGPIIPNGNIGPTPTNIRGEIPTEVPAGSDANVPRSATIQDAEATPAEGEEAAAPGTFGYYAPAGGPQQNGPTPAAGESATPSPEATPPASPTEPESR